MARLDQPQLLVDLLELVGRAGPITLFVGQLDVGVIDMVVQPGLVDLLALGFYFHTAPLSLDNRYRRLRPGLISRSDTKMRRNQPQT
jgi:hypothetical protein